MQVVYQRKTKVDESYMEMIGESTETKPAGKVGSENIAEMSIFVELDTREGYYFKNNNWNHKIGG